VDGVFELLELQGETRVDWRGLGTELGDAGMVETGMCAGEEQGGAQAERGNAVAVSLGDSCNHGVQAEPSEVIGHSALGDGVGHLPGEHSYLLA
jgi:hypothetical protein